jgi:hypothetical protein
MKKNYKEETEVEKFRKAQEVIRDYLRQFEVLKDNYDILAIYFKYNVIDLNWDNFAIEVSFLVSDDTTIGQHVERFEIKFLNQTKPEMVHYELVQELEMQKVRKRQKPIQWLKDIENEMYLGIPRPKRNYNTD